MRRLFATKLERFITLKSTSLDRVLQITAAFFADKTEIVYTFKPETLRVSHTPTGSEAHATIGIHWWTKVPSDLHDSDAADNCWFDSRLVRSTQLGVEARADMHGQIVYYLEAPSAAVSYKVSAGVGPQPAFDVPHSQCEKDYESEASLVLAPGTIVEDAGFIVYPTVAARGSEMCRQIRYRGQLYWMLEASTSAEGYGADEGHNDQTYLERTDNLASSEWQ